MNDFNDSRRQWSSWNMISTTRLGLFVFVLLCRHHCLMNLIIPIDFLLSWKCTSSSATQTTIHRHENLFDPSLTTMSIIFRYSIMFHNIIYLSPIDRLLLTYSFNDIDYNQQCFVHEWILIIFELHKTWLLSSES